MKIVRILAAGLLFALSSSVQGQSSAKLSLSFEENHGQAAAEALFLARGPGYNLVLTSSGNQLLLRHSGQRLSMRTTLVGANKNPAIRGEEKQSGKVHYLSGASALRDIPTYARVRYERVYSGIDLVYYGNQKGLEYDFVVNADSDPSRIALQFDGADGMTLDPQGNLVLKSGKSEVIQHKPVVYQEVRGLRKDIPAAYRLMAMNTVTFDIGSYDHKAPLVIDPILSYSTFLGGGSGDDDARAVATDSAGNVYITGSTTAMNFPTAAPIQPNSGSQDPDAPSSDAFITKLNPTGTAMIYSTYIGGASDDFSNAIAVDSSGNVVIAGSTDSTDFPTTANAIRRTCNLAADGECSDAFVVKLNAAGSALVYATYLGGTDDDVARGVAVDPSGNAYVAGETSSIDFPVTPGLNTIPASGGFVTKLSSNGAMVYSTYCLMGGPPTPIDVRGIAVNSAGVAFITGTANFTWPTAFVSSFTAAGVTNYFSSLPGIDGSEGHAIAVDASGDAYVAGKTLSPASPLQSSGVQPTYGGGPAFRTTDGGSTWIPSGRSTLILPWYAIAVGARGPSAAGPSIIYAAADDGLNGHVVKSSDGGVTWIGRSPFFGPRTLVADPVLVDTVYAGTHAQGVFKTTDGGISWLQTSLNSVFVTALAMADSNTIYAGTDSNGVYKSTDAGNTWAQVNNGLVNSTVNTIAIASTVPPTVYAGTGNGIYKTTNGGVNWNAANSGLFDPNVNAIVVDSRNPHLIYSGTNSVGIFRSLNDGNFWLASNSGVADSGRVVTAMTQDQSTGTLYAAVGVSNVSTVYKSNDGINWIPTTLATARVTSLGADPSISGSVYAATTGGSDAFVAKWDPSGKLAAWTYLGGYRDDSANAIALDASGNVYVAGETSSTNFPMANAIQSTFAGGSDALTDAFVVKLDATLSTMTYSTYLGGGSNDFARGIAVDSSGNAYVVGQTSSADFPATPSALIPVQPGLLDGFLAKISESNTLFYSVAPRGGISSTSQGAGAAISTGYARIQPAAGTTTPSGLAIFDYRENNVLVSEASVPASPLISSGRIYAEVNSTLNTGVAIANPNGQPVTLNFYFTDGNGQNFGAGSTTLDPNVQIAKFLDQAPFNAGSSVFGTFTFTASAPVSVIALRGLTNERGEFLMTTLPVSDLSVPASSGTILFPHFADGVGWTTQILLINTTDTPMSGSIQFASLPPQSYSVPVRSAVKVATAGVSLPVLTGAVLVTPAAGSNTPAGVTVFSFKNNGVTVTEASVPALRTANAFRLYVEASGRAPDIGSIETGVAVANPSASDAAVTFELNSLAGVSTGLSGSAIVPANGHIAKFLNQIQGFDKLPLPFQGVLRVSTSSPGGMTVVGLRGRYNERGDFLITTTQPTNEAAPASTAEEFFPHFADGGGFTTQFILFNGATDQSSSGSLRFFTQTGQTFNLTLR